jgi:hypothetical protein
VILLAALASVALAEDGPPALSGRVFTDVYVPTREEPTQTPLRQASTSIWIQADPKVGTRSSAHFTLTGDYFETSLDGNPDVRKLRMGLREAYVNYAYQGLEFKVGRQIVPWGKSDAINPTDVLPAKDYTFFNPDEEVRRIGATSALIAWTPDKGRSPFTLTTVWTPVFPQTRLLISPSSIPRDPSVTVTTTPVSPKASLTNSDLAIRVSYAGDGWDFAALVFRGYNHMPEFKAEGLSVFPVFNQVRVLGGDFSFTSGAWVFRGESAYVWTQNDDGNNRFVQPNHWDTVLGVERPVGDDWRAQVQFVARLHTEYQDILEPDPSFPADTLNRETIKANALLLGYQFETRTGLTFRLAYSPSKSDVEAELFTIGNFMGGDYLLRPKLTYAWTDALKLTLGAEYYAGPVNRPLGSLQFYNSVFFETKYSF